MADKNIQTLQYAIRAPNGGINTFQTEVNKKTGASVTYDTTGLFQKKAVLRSDPVTLSNGSKGYRTDFAGNVRQDYDLGYLQKISEQSNNQRAAFINKNFTAPQKANFKGLPGVTNVAQTNPNPPITPAGAGGGGGSAPAARGVTGAAPPPRQLPGPGSTQNTPTDSGTNLKLGSNDGLRYPQDIAETGQDIIKFQACELSNRFGDTNLPTDQDSSGSGFDFKWRDPYAPPISGEVVFIGIQAPISDQNIVEWGPDSLNPFQSAAFAVSLGIMQNKKGEGITEALESLSTNILGAATQYQDRIQKYLAGQAASINNVLARTDNVVLNPNLELLFNGPQLRPFNFQFKMSAREPKEAETIKRIIKFFKYHMAVRKEQDLFLKAPHVFNIEYVYNNNDNTPHPGINQIKTCALTSFSVDYTPLGTYMTYQDGTMVSYTLSMQFQELIPIYDTDYSGNSTIGY